LQVTSAEVLGGLQGSTALSQLIHERAKIVVDQQPKKFLLSFDYRYVGFIKEGKDNIEFLWITTGSERINGFSDDDFGMLIHLLLSSSSSRT
jgi:hypothetical protein